MLLKPILMICVLAAALHGAPAGADELGAILEQGGFESARLGDPITSFNGLERLGADGESNTVTYRRRGDELRIDGAVIDGIAYSFFDGRRALEAFLEQHDDRLVTEALNEVYESDPEAGQMDAVLERMQFLSLEREEW